MLAAGAYAMRSPGPVCCDPTQSEERPAAIVPHDEALRRTRRIGMRCKQDVVDQT
jgi:hypothetical protein